MLRYEGSVAMVAEAGERAKGEVAGGGGGRRLAKATGAQTASGQLPYLVEKLTDFG